MHRRVLLDQEGAKRSLRSPLRTGAVRWGPCRGGQNPHAFVELDVMPSWEEHTRQHTIG